MNKSKNKLVVSVINRNYFIIVIFYCVIAASCNDNQVPESNLPPNETGIKLQFSDSNETGKFRIISYDHGWERVFRHENKVRNRNKILPSFIIDDAGENVYVNDFGDRLFQLSGRTGKVLSESELPNFANLTYQTPIEYSQDDSVILGEIQGQWFLFDSGLTSIKYLNPTIEYKELNKANAIIGDSLIDVVGAPSKEESILFRDNFTLIDIAIGSRQDSLQLVTTYQCENGKDTVVSYMLPKL